MQIVPGLTFLLIMISSIVTHAQEVRRVTGFLIQRKDQIQDRYDLYLQNGLKQRRLKINPEDGYSAGSRAFLHDYLVGEPVAIEALVDDDTISFPERTMSVTLVTPRTRVGVFFNRVFFAVSAPDVYSTEYPSMRFHFPTGKTGEMSLTGVPLEQGMLGSFLKMAQDKKPLMFFVQGEYSDFGSLDVFMAMPLLESVDVDGLNASMVDSVQLGFGPLYKEDGQFLVRLYGLLKAPLSPATPEDAEYLTSVVGKNILFTSRLLSDRALVTRENIRVVDDQQCQGLFFGDK